MVLIGPRGHVIADTIAVTGDGRIDNENIDLGGFNEGTVTAFVISPGRDGTYGDSASPETPAQLVDEIETEYASETASGSQIRSQLRANTVEATGSDDLIVTQNFGYTDGQLTIETAGPAETGGTLTVVGTTNVRPTDTTILLNLLDENRNAIELGSTTQWGPDGRWSVEIPLGEIPPGEYTLEADNGDTTTRRTVEILEEGALEIDVDVGSSQSGTDTDESDTGETNESTSESNSTADTGVNSTDSPPESGGDSNATEADAAADSENPGNETSTADNDGTEDQPGFGVVLTLIALFGAGLLVGRRNA
jgi:major cell surface glycoprotein (TIGR04216 family)